MNVNCPSPFSSDNEGDDQPLNITHPLKPHWTFWVWRADPDTEVNSKNWLSFLREQFTLKTIEEFYALQHRIAPPSQLRPEIQYAYFKKGIVPTYEDPRNVKGGIWWLDVEQRYKYNKLDKVWVELLMAVLGAQFATSNPFVNGVMLKVRDDVGRLEIWVSDAACRKSNYEIRDIICEKLGIVTTESIVFRRHPIPHEKVVTEFL